jgi:Caspase domain
MARWIGQRTVIIAAVLAVLLPVGYAAAETRVALIIGNSAYQKADLRLPNPANDAAAMARALKTAGFETIVQLNASRTDFYKALSQFTDKISRDPHAVGLFYYAGHAVQADGINWLIPVDANINSQGDLEPSAFDAARVLKSMTAAQNEMNIVILDACRNNPLPKTRGMDRGLARIDAPSGTFIAFSAGPGQTAQDGAAGTNGVFTGEFIKAMMEPGLPLEQVFKKVVIGVKADTHGAQTPWQESSLQGDFSFIPKNASGATVANANAAAAAATPNAPARHVDNANELEQSYWDRIKDSSDPADFKDYKTQYPNGSHVAEATLLIKKLSRSTVTASAPPQGGAATAATRSVAPQPTASHPSVDPAAVGHWTMKINGSTWYWDVKANGTYASWSAGPIPGSHSGTVAVADGHWSMNATTTNWVDGGTYQFTNPDTLVVTGRLGTGAWLRVK